MRFARGGGFEYFDHVDSKYVWIDSDLMMTKAKTRSLQSPPQFANDEAQPRASTFFARVAPNQSEQALSGLAERFRERNIPEHSASLEASKVYVVPIQTKAH